MDSRQIVNRLRTTHKFTPAANLIENLEKQNALLQIELRQANKKIEQYERRSEDYLTIYRLLLKHHYPGEYDAPTNGNNHT